VFASSVKIFRANFKASSFMGLIPARSYTGNSDGVSYVRDITVYTMITQIPQPRW
jgi:hypothetical protein